MGMTKLNSKTLWPIVVIAGLAVACFCFFLLFYPSHFYFKGQNQLFLMSWQYAVCQACMGDMPGGRVPDSVLL